MVLPSEPPSLPEAEATTEQPLREQQSTLAPIDHTTQTRSTPGSTEPQPPEPDLPTLPQQHRYPSRVRKPPERLEL